MSDQTPAPDPGVSHTDEPTDVGQTDGEQGAIDGEQGAIPESPALKALYETLAGAQAGLDLRRDEVAKDLTELATQEAHWNEEATKAYQADDDDAYAHAVEQVHACRDLRTQLMTDLGGDPERYGVTADSTLDTQPDPGAGAMRSITPAETESQPAE